MNSFSLKHYNYETTNYIILFIYFFRQKERKEKVIHIKFEFENI